MLGILLMPRIVQWERQIGSRLRLRDLFVFFTVVKRGSMTKAAAVLGVSTPSISEVIADLEQALGVRLLDRTPRGVLVTAYGEALLRRGEAAFDELRQGINEIELLSDPTAGEVNVGCPELIATILPPIVDLFRSNYPRAILGIDHEIFPTFAPRLRDRSLDLVLMRMRGHDPAGDSAPDDLSVEYLFDDILILVTGANSEWAHRRKLKLADLQHADWILPGRGSWGHRVVGEAFQTHGLDPPRISIKSLSGHLQANLTGHGNFVTAIALSVFDFYRERFCLKRLPVDLPARRWPVAVMTLKGRTLSPVAERFIDCVRQSTKAAPHQTAYD